MKEKKIANIIIWICFALILSLFTAEILWLGFNYDTLAAAKDMGVMVWESYILIVIGLSMILPATIASALYWKYFAFEVTKS